MTGGTALSAGVDYTIAADTGSSIEVGKAGVTAIFTMAVSTLVDWTKHLDCVQICGESTYLLGSNLAGMTANTGDKYAYISHTQAVVIGAKTYNVQCYFGDGSAAGTKNTIKFATF